MGLISKYKTHRIVKYGFIGGISTIIHIGIAYIYIYFVNDSILISNITGFLFAFGFSYILQSKFVFKHTISYMKAIKYFIVQFMALLISIAISNFTPLSNSYLKVLIVILILPFMTYFLHKIWTFSGSNIEKEKEFYE